MPAPDTSQLDWSAAELALWRPKDEPYAELEQILVRALQRAHRDAGVMRVLPLFLWRALPRMHWERLVEASRAARVLPELGLVTELAARASRQPELQALAEELRPFASNAPREFFTTASAAERRLAELNTPAVARRWGFVMNMSEASFQATFEKHHGLE